MTNEQMADYSLIIKADSGYESTTEGRCSAEQYGQAIAALHGEAPQRKPLTDEQMQFLATAIEQAQQIIDTHNAEFITVRDDLRRCAELLAAHGIKE